MLIGVPGCWASRCVWAFSRHTEWDSYANRWRVGAFLHSLVTRGVPPVSETEAGPAPSHPGRMGEERHQDNGIHAGSVAGDAHTDDPAVRAGPIDPDPAAAAAVACAQDISQGLEVLMQRCYFENKALIGCIEAGGEPCDCITQAVATTEIRSCFGDCWLIARSAFCSVSAEHARAKAAEGMQAPIMVDNLATHTDLRRRDAVVEAVAIMSYAPTEVDSVTMAMAAKRQPTRPGSDGTSRAFSYSQIVPDAAKDPSEMAAVWQPGRVEVFMFNNCTTEIEVQVSVLGHGKVAPQDQ